MERLSESVEDWRGLEMAAVDVMDAYPEPIDNEFSSVDELEYKDKVVENLVDNMHEYLSFSTARDLMKLIAANL